MENYINQNRYDMENLKSDQNIEIINQSIEKIYFEE